MKIRLLVDSTTEIMPEYKARVHVVPLTVFFGEKSYVDGVDIDHNTFYQKLIESDVLPTTSQPNPLDFAKEYEEAKKNNEACIVIAFTQIKLSGTYQSATIAAQDYDNVYVIDSGSVAIGTAILVELALRYIDQGLDVKTVVEK